MPSDSQKVGEVSAIGSADDHKPSSLPDPAANTPVTNLPDGSMEDVN
jgi:hypothetical protein